MEQRSDRFATRRLPDLGLDQGEAGTIGPALEFADELFKDQARNPPAPNKPITGSTGVAEFLEEGSILALKGAKLVDNKWSAPGATGCGSFLVELILDPIINLARSSRST